jgi:hypothetical protein
MSTDGSIAGTAGYLLWYLGELIFKWIPGVTVSLATSQGGDDVAVAPVPVITHAVTTGDIVDFLHITADPDLYMRIVDMWRGFVAISTFLSLLFGAFFIYCFIRIVQHRRGHARHIEHLQHTILHADVPKTHLRWDRIQEQIISEDHQSWRLAILEADIMLGELLDKLGYRGETMADKMRTVERGDFRSIDMAWEAHKVRNKVAHEGAGLALSHREAKRVIDLYGTVFREFDFVA